MTEGIGRALQVAGMLVLPVALWVGLVHDQVRLEVALLALGGALFLIGRAMRGSEES